MKLAVRLAALALHGPSLAICAWATARLGGARRDAWRHPGGRLRWRRRACAGAGANREAQAIAEEVYLYGFPMIVNYKVTYEYATTSRSSR